MDRIRQIATSHTGSKVALAEFERVVQVFDIDSLQVVSEFETVLDFGGRRMVINDEGNICICGCWERHGICAYNSTTGTLLWQRKDLKKVQVMQLIRSDNSVLFAQFEKGASRLIDVNTGEDIQKLPGVRGYYESAFSPLKVLTRYSHFEIINAKTSARVAKIPTQLFGTLDIAFSPNSVIISESGKPVSCYHYAGGLNWKLEPIAEGHFFRLAYNRHLNQLLAIGLQFNHSEKKLHYINPDNGTVQKEISIQCPLETQFVLAGQYVVTSDRVLINIENGSSQSF